MQYRPQDLHTSDFDYTLPETHIAQVPLEPRDAARLLILDRDSGQTSHRRIYDLPSLLRPQDLLVVNRSKVIPGRIHGRLHGGARAEFLLLRKLGLGQWESLARPARRLRLGSSVAISPKLNARITGVGERGLREFALEAADGESLSGTELDAALLDAGEVPIPPYIRGWQGDSARYQTIFARVDGSAAAPTAGLHFTHELLERLRHAGVACVEITLHVGMDTFRPVAGELLDEHSMHREWYEVPAEAAQQIARTRANGGRVIAIGTTSVRTLEAWAATGVTSGWTNLFIRPGFKFSVVDALLTNFHLPRSTLMMLVSAFAGRERVLDTYAEAIRHSYRFYSFGDAMLIT